MKCAVFFFLATAFAVAASVPVDTMDETDEDFLLANETQMEPEEQDDNETEISGDFATKNFSRTEENEETKLSVRSLTDEEEPIGEDHASGSDPGSAEIQTASGIQELPTNDGEVSTTEAPTEEAEDPSEEAEDPTTADEDPTEGDEDDMGEQEEEEETGDSK